VAIVEHPSKRAHATARAGRARTLDRDVGEIGLLCFVEAQLAARLREQSTVGVKPPETSSRSQARSVFSAATPSPATSRTAETRNRPFVPAT
jgi:hypothetical protein